MEFDIMQCGNMEFDNMYSEIFSRSRLLLGDEGLQRLRNNKFILFGTGGVGSWCAEALIRTGAEHLTIVDSDEVCSSNINRQLMANTQTLRQPKVDAMRQHILEVNPEAEVSALKRRFTAETAGSFNLQDYDCIIDCIDSLKDKALLIELATKTDALFLSSMGAALKSDPSLIRMAEFWKVKGCPLARALRQRFKREHRFPAKKFQCVYSEERLSNRYADPEGANGSLMHITAIFGMTLAGKAIQRISLLEK